MIRYEFELPKPPSVNNMYFNNQNGRGHGRIPTSEYKTWIELAGLDLGYHKNKPTLTGKLRVQYLYGRHRDNRRRDLLNLEKALSDFLVKAMVIKDDCQIEEARMAWVDDVREGRVRVIIEQEEEAQKCLEM